MILKDLALNGDLDYKKKGKDLHESGVKNKQGESAVNCPPEDRGQANGRD